MFKFCENILRHLKLLRVLKLPNLFVPVFLGFRGPLSHAKLPEKYDPAPPMGLR